MAAAMTDWPYVISLDLQNNDSDWLLVSDGDGNNATYGEQSATTLDLVASLLVGFFLAVIIFLSVAGNLLVCIAVYTDRTLRKVGNLFIVSLAISDLFVACLVMVFAVANDLQGFWVFGEKFCDIWIAFDVMCSTASILNLCAISMDRYIHIKDPLRYGRWMTKRVIYSSIFGIWLLAALISFLPVSMDLHKPPRPLLQSSAGSGGDDLEGSGDLGDDLGSGTEPSWVLDDDAAAASITESLSPFLSASAGDSDVDYQIADQPQCALDLTPTYAIVSSCISFYLPCLVMLAIYSRLFFYAKKHVQNIKAVTRPVILLGRFEPDPNSPAAVGDPAEASLRSTIPGAKGKRRHSPTTNSNYHVSDHKAAITLGVIMGVFLICWVPFFCVNIVASFCKTCIPPIVFKFLTWLGYSNSAFNPIIYSIFNLDFRLAFQKILTLRTRSCCGCRCDQDRLYGLDHHQYQVRMEHLRNRAMTPYATNGRSVANGDHQVEMNNALHSYSAADDVTEVAPAATVVHGPSVRVHANGHGNGERHGSDQPLLTAEKVV